MKIRNGFVSNSSSSSFIIAKSFLSEAQWDQLHKWASELEEIKGGSWGDSGDTYDSNGKYFYIETYYIYEEFNKILQELKIDTANGYWLP